MQIIKISPRGFCSGVVNAWKIVKDTIKQNPECRVFMLGWFVHNQKMLDEVRSDNLFILDDTNLTRYELVKNLKVQPNDILILSAHGTDEKTIKLAKSKGLKIIDTTCEYVYKTHDVIKNGLINNKQVVYLGKENHPESLAALSISDKVILVTDPQQLMDINFNLPTIITNQTTLSIYDLKSCYQFIEQHFTDYEIKNDLCLATQQRQEALINLKTKLDVLIVVGDNKSNNSQQLLKIGKYKKIPLCFLVNSLQEVQSLNLNPKYVVGITSGASTPTSLTNTIIKYLQEL